MSKLGKFVFLVLFMFSLAGCTGESTPAGSTLPLQTESLTEEPVAPVKITAVKPIETPLEVSPTEQTETSLKVTSTEPLETSSESSSAEEAPKLSGTWRVNAASGDQPSTREKAKKLNLLLVNPLVLEFNFSTSMMNLQWTAKPHAAGEACEMRMTFTAVRSKKHCGCPLVSFKLTKASSDQLFHTECLVQIPSEVRPGTPEELVEQVKAQLEGTYQIILDKQDLTLVREESEGASLQIELQGSL